MCTCTPPPGFPSCTLSCSKVTARLPKTRWLDDFFARVRPTNAAFTTAANCHAPYIISLGLEVTAGPFGTHRARLCHAFSGMPAMTLAVICLEHQFVAAVSLSGLLTWRCLWRQTTNCYVSSISHNATLMQWAYALANLHEPSSSCNSGM